MEDYYKILQVERTAAPRDIQKAFRKLAKKFHPDTNPNNPQAEEIFKKINEAYDTLGDETKKADYDMRRFGPGPESQARETNSEPRKGAAYRPNPNMSAQDFAKTSSFFEGFFGFDPDSDSPELKKENEKVKAVKTKDLYKQMFGKDFKF